ncbi:MAG: PRC-barrel domain-containing protein [Bdellovibrionaceae bacterium]|nr:PRC-barrel domain-containing protein [Bdellovibrionales bacterium]MCB9254451.1 PRC-barrel domain-containing protein [Pseudobdellovibrionaceae bacterium]
MYENRNIEFFSTLRDYHIRTSDNKILGKLQDIYFDDIHWMARYFVVDTHKWLPGKKVLLSPLALSGIDRADRVIDFALNAEHVQAAPNADMAKPVSRQLEDALHRYYGWPQYWVPDTISPIRLYPYRMPGEDLPVPVAETLEKRLKKKEAHLRSVDEICGYHMEGLGQRVGKVEDVILDLENGHLLHLVVNTGSWFKSEMRIVPTVMVTSIQWADRRLSVLLPAERVVRSAEFAKPENIQEWKDSEILAYYFEDRGTQNAGQGG